MNKTYVEINLDSLGQNVKEITKKYDDYNYYIGVIKSNAYGHGEYIVNELVKNGINYIAVSYIDEALTVRKYNKTIPILCLQPININDLDLALKNDITIVVHDKYYLDKLLKYKLNKKVKVHIKIDTGMNRLGFKNKEELKDAVLKINENKYLILEGIFSHFATIGVFDKNFDNQINKFLQITSLIDLNEIPIRHFGSSVTLLAHPKITFTNGIRMGILLYGYNVSPTSSNIGIKNKLRNIRNRYMQKKYNISKTYSNVDIKLKPSMKMYTNIIQIKKVKKGEYIGYGAKYKAENNMTIAILPIGYNNGIGKRVNNRYVLINNKKYYVVGPIGMNMMSIQVDSNVKVDDKVLIMGDKITLGQMSRFEGISISETLLNIGKNNKKVYVKDNNIIFEEE